MKAAMGRLGWTPATFWTATPWEFWAALDGWMDAHVPRRSGGPLSDDEIATLEDMKRRFPDETRRAPSRTPSARRKGSTPGSRP